MQMVEEDAIRRAQIVDKVELAANPNFWNFYLLGEVHPFKNQPFYFSAGLFVGSQNFVHFRNTNEGALGFLYDANQKVEDYNRLYRTNYPPIGLKFGDYIFTADENGNIDVHTVSAWLSMQVCCSGAHLSSCSTMVPRSIHRAATQASPVP